MWGYASGGRGETQKAMCGWGKVIQGDIKTPGRERETKCVRKRELSNASLLLPVCCREAGVSVWGGVGLLAELGPCRAVCPPLHCLILHF